MEDKLNKKNYPETKNIVCAQDVGVHSKDDNKLTDEALEQAAGGAALPRPPKHLPDTDSGYTASQF